MIEKLIKKYQNKQLVISIIGMGYVGLPLSILYAKNNIRTIGIDIDEKKIDSLLKGKSYINHIKNKSIKELIDNKKFFPTVDFKEVGKSDVIILCLPTPLNKFREPNLSYINKTLENIKKFLKKGQLISLESTSYPGTTEDIFIPLIKEKGFEIGQDFFVIYSPEREDPGNTVYPSEKIPKVVGGLSKNCLNLGINLYKLVIKEVIPVSSTKVAEMTKLLENIHRCINISLVNELKPLCLEMDIDIYEVINAAKTKPFGFTPYYPGPGLGGHCIPIDPFYLTWKAKEYKMSTKFIELAGEVNSEMPHFVLKRIGEALNTKSKSLKNSKILILGISYKKNVDDIRESPALELIKLLTKQEAIVYYSDPYFSEFPTSRNLLFKSKSISINKKNLNKFDLTLLVTNHDSFDYELIEKESNLIVDTRGVYKASSKVILA